MKYKMLKEVLEAADTHKYKVKKIESEERKSNRTGSPVVKKVKWTVVDDKGVARDGYFDKKSEAEAVVNRLNNPKTVNEEEMAITRRQVRPNPLRNQHGMRKKVMPVIMQAKREGAEGPEEILAWVKKTYPNAKYDFMNAVKTALRLN